MKAPEQALHDHRLMSEGLLTPGEVFGRDAAAMAFRSSAKRNASRRRSRTPWRIILDIPRKADVQRMSQR